MIRINLSKKKKLLKFIRILNIGLYDETKSFKQLTTIHAGGKIDLVVYPFSIEKLVDLLVFLDKNKIKHVLLGCGSNVLANDKRYKGVVILGNKIPKEVKIKKIDEEKYEVIASFNVNLPYLSYKLYEYGLTGAEALSTIPGTVGGLLKMNASCFDYHNENHFIKALVYKDKDIYYIKQKEVGFSYRKTSGDYIYLYSHFIFEKGDKVKISKLMEYYKKQRQIKQPQKEFSFGSTFINPPNVSAGSLIENAGLKGYNYNGAMVSLEHANFILNKNNANAKNIYKLIKKIRKIIFNKEKIKLQNEVVFIQFKQLK